MPTPEHASEGRSTPDSDDPTYVGRLACPWDDDDGDAERRGEELDPPSRDGVDHQKVAMGPLDALEQSCS